MPRVNPLPFAPLPHAMLEDGGLTALDIRVAGLILGWLRARPSGWVLNDILADRAGVKLRALQYSLRRLQDRDWFRCEADTSNRSRRRITALWRTGERVDPKEAAWECTPSLQNGAPSAVQPGASKKEFRTKNQDIEFP